jgi:hypothetical protein
VTGHPNTSGLKPFKPGDVGNPQGRNQYTYRRIAEDALEQWCRENGDALIKTICDEAKKNRAWAAKLMLDRILPAVTKHDVEAHVSGAVEVTREGEWTELAGGIRRLKSNGRELPARKGNGSADTGDSS